jgi:hypothetical protein
MMNDRKQSVRRILITVAIIYVVFCVCSCALQRRLLYFPTEIPANAVESVAQEHGFVAWKNPAGEIIGWKIPADGTATGSVLIFHGNAGCAVGRDYLARPIHEMGLLASLPSRGSAPARLESIATNAPGQETGAPHNAVNVDVFV